MTKGESISEREFRMYNIDLKANKMETIAGVIKIKGEKFEFEKTKMSDLLADEVLIKIVAAGICSKEMAMVDQQIHNPDFSILWTHEGGGIVEKVGNNVKHLQQGDHVVLTFGSCGKCERCTQGHPAYCKVREQLNFSDSRHHGTHNHADLTTGKKFHQDGYSPSLLATHVIAHQNNTIKVPNDAPLEILGPLGFEVQNGAGAVINSLKVSRGKSIVISGADVTGLSAVLAAVACSAGTIAVVDADSERLNFAMELGATHTIDSWEQNVSEELKNIQPQGFDFGLDITGRSDIINSLLSSLKPLAEMGLLGVSTEPLEIDMNSFVSRGLILKEIVGGDSIPSEFLPQLVNMYLHGEFPFDKLITKYNLADINKAIKDCENGSSIKPVLLI
ncbi:NAD(P)-dependent alcohol dehydrogenase [Dyadobacter luteus]|uniref:NAD(P)-dependent alcohol dehydrogenase n=1 Tax=Dyadobacter luteus TaxID=2259619 RepID=A0A3D8Y9G8_9BACT|nr:alcohol dehydrogenase catalytic domain-containing protein [Dyadobacter luteus]REA60116.1 NAD(P)-dependent alcohol dehydrogenase [Dyadobacter luteus]